MAVTLIWRYIRATDHSSFPLQEHLLVSTPSLVLLFTKYSMASLNATAPVTSDGGPPYTNLHLDDSLGVAFIGLIFAAM